MEFVKPKPGSEKHKKAREILENYTISVANGGVFTVESKDGSESYSCEIYRFEDGYMFDCTCPEWINKKPADGCVHFYMILLYAVDKNVEIPPAGKIAEDVFESGVEEEIGDAEEIEAEIDEVEEILKEAEDEIGDLVSEGTGEGLAEADEVAEDEEEVQRDVETGEVHKEVEAKKTLMDVDWVAQPVEMLTKRAKVAKAIRGRVRMKDGKFLADWEDGCETALIVKEKLIDAKCTCEEFEAEKTCNHIAYLWKRYGMQEYVALKEKQLKKSEVTEVADVAETKARMKVKDLPKDNLYDLFLDLLEGEPDLIEIFGETGTCKSAIALRLLNDALKKGLKVLYIDTEGNLRPSQRPKDYVYMPSFDELKRYIGVRGKRMLKDGYHVIILDSIGIPVLGAYAAASLHQRGQMLLDMQAIAYILKGYAVKNKCLVLVINQPVSELSCLDIEDPVERQRAIHERRPFGDKMEYFSKEILRTRLVSTSDEETIVQVEAWRSRSFGRGALLFKVKVTSEGVEIL